MSSKGSIKVVSINKQGNKVINYSCLVNDSEQISLTKDELVEKINNGEVCNARIQIYKGQVIIRPNLENKDSNKSEKSKKKETKQKSTSKETKGYEGNVTSEKLMDVLADVFGIVQYKEEFTQRFFERHPDLVNKQFSSSNLNDKLRAMKAMSDFWKLVAYNQADRTYKIMMESIDNMEYEAYCKENGIIDEGE